VANHIAKEVPLKLAGQVFPAHLIVLDGQRDRCYFGNELDEATQSYSGYS
jgi:hypothetical protein